MFELAVLLNREATRHHNCVYQILRTNKKIDICKHSIPLLVLSHRLSLSNRLRSGVLYYPTTEKWQRSRSIRKSCENLFSRLRQHTPTISISVYLLQAFNSTILKWI
jgi:hypothetical protein